MSFFPSLNIGVTGSAFPIYSALVGGSDGTNLRALLTDAGGQLKVLVENFPATQPVSGTVAATQSGTWTVGISAAQTIAVTNAGTFAVQAACTQSTSPWVVSLASTTITGNVSVVGTDADNAANSTTKLPTIPARANASAPSWTEGHEVPLSTDLAGNLRVSITGSVIANNNITEWNSVALGSPSAYGTSPGAVNVIGVNAFITNTPTVNQGTSPWVVSLTSTTITGTVAVTQSTNPWTIQGDSASGASKAGNPVQTGGVFNTTQPTVTTGQTVESQYTARGAQIVATGVDTFNVTINTALPAGTNVIGHVITDTGSTTVVTGTVAVTQSTSPWVVSLTSTTITGTVAVTQSGNWTNRIVGNTGATLDSAPAATAPTNVLQVGGTFTTSPTTLTSGQAGSLNLDSAQNLLVNLKTALPAGSNVIGHVITDSGSTTVVTGTVAVTQSTSPWVVAGGLTNNNAAPSTNNVGALGYLANAAAPSWTEGDLVLGSVDLAGNQRVVLKAETTKVIGTVNQGTSPWVVSLSSTTITGTVAVTQSTSPWVTNMTQWASTALGTPTNFGTTPGAVIAGSVNSSVFIGTVAAVAAASGVQKVGIVGNSGATLDSTIGAGTAPTNAVAVSGIYNTTAPAPTNGQAVALQIDQSGNLLNFPGVEFVAGAAWSSATAQNTLQYPTGTATQGQVNGATAVIVQLDQTSTLSAGAVTFQGTFDNINWVTIPPSQVQSPGSGANYHLLSNPYTFVASTNTPVLLMLLGYIAVRIKLTTAITGSGTVTPYWTTFSGVSPFSLNTQPVDITGINGNGVITAASGVMQVGIVGNGGAAFDAAKAATAPANAIQIGLLAATAYPTAVTGGQLVGAMADKAGRTTVVLNTVRDLVGTADLNSSSSSAVSFISAGASGVFNDIVTLVITNESSTATIVSLSDNGSGGNVHKYAIAANGGIVINYPTPLPQGTSAAAWDVLNSAAVALDYHAVFVKNK